MTPASPSDTPLSDKLRDRLDAANNSWDSGDWSHLAVDAVYKAVELEIDLATARAEAAINMENFKVTNQAYVKHDADLIAARAEVEQAAAHARELRADREEIKQLLGATIIRLKELGETTFKFDAALAAREVKP